MPYRLAVLAALVVLAGEAAAQPVDTDAVGPIDSPVPVVMANSKVLAFLMPGDVPASISLMHGEGSCAYDHGLVVVKLGQPTSAESFAEGYWKTIFKKDDELIGCLDVRDGYITVIASPASQLTALSGVLAEVRRAAYAKHGEPITNAADPMILPRTQQRVSAQHGSGMWKAVDGTRYDTAGGDALVSIFPLGFGSTMYVIGVADGPCTPGTTAADATVASRLFPSELGAVWIDSGEYKLRWKAWACVASGGAITVMGPIAGDQPPEEMESHTLKAMVTAVARSYGIEIAAPSSGGGGGGGGGSSYRRGGAMVMSLAYLGAMSFGPESGDRTRGGLAGLGIRASTGSRGGGAGFAFAFDVELGYGNSELLGELRGGLGVSLGRKILVDATVGGSLGSTGPAAAIDLHGEASVTLPWGKRGAMWLGGLHAVGVGGPDHTRVEGRLLFGGKRDGVFSVGARFVRFGDSVADDGVTAMSNGDAILVTVGGGALLRE